MEVSYQDVFGRISTNPHLTAVSLVEYSGRMFSPNTFLARLRPKEYRQVPESILNATLKDVHDLVQYLAVQVQRAIWGQDLGNTFAVSYLFILGTVRCLDSD